MERTEKLVKHLDTHVVFWMYNKAMEKIPVRIQTILADASVVRISPMVLLELEYMYEIGRANVSAARIAQWLKEHTKIQVAKTAFLDVIEHAQSLRWTRDAFDRIITASAAAENATLITQDRVIREHYKKAIW